MKQFLYILLLIVFFGFNAQRIEAKETIQDNYIPNSASEYQYISCLSDFFNPIASNESWQYSSQSLFPTLSNFLVKTDLFNSKNGLIRGGSTNRCVVNSETQITRFEGVDIIHPFNYFW